MPAKPPRPGPPRLPAVRDEVSPGAVHALRPIPHDDTPTPLPPPPDRRPLPRGYAGHRGSVSGVLGQSSADEEEHTLIGVAPPPAPPPRDRLDSVEIAAGRLLDELATERRESEDLRRQLRDADAARRAEAARIQSPPPKRADWAKAGLALVGALSLFLGGAGTYLGARAAAQESTVSRVEAKTTAQATVTTDLSPRVVELERDNRALLAWVRARDDYDRQVFHTLGVEIPPQVNAPPVKPLETRAPRRTSAVRGGVVVEILTAPPELP